MDFALFQEEAGWTRFHGWLSYHQLKLVASIADAIPPSLHHDVGFRGVNNSEQLPLFDRRHVESVEGTVVLGHDFFVVVEREF